MAAAKGKYISLGFLYLTMVTCRLATDQTQDGDKKTLKLLVLLPMKPGAAKLPFGGEMCGAAVYSAFEKIKRNNLLPGFNLEATFEDTGCNAIKGLGVAYERLRRERYDAILGPQCSQVCRIVGRLASYLNIPIFSGLCQDVEMSNKAEFSTLTRFLATFEMTGFAVCQLLHTYDWYRVSILAEQYADIIWVLTRTGLQYAFDRCNVTVALSSLMSKNDNLEQKLTEAANISRVIIVATMGDTFRHLMKIAYDKGYHKGDYIFININFYTQRKIFGDFRWQQGKEDDDMVRAVFPAVFFLSYYNRRSTADYEQFVKDVKKGSAEYFDYHYADDEQVPYPAANLFEATYLLAYAFNESYSLGYNTSDGRRMAQRITGRSLPSLTGDLIINENGDREQAYTWTHMQDLDTGEVQEIGHYFSRNKSLLLLDIISWPGSRSHPPPDTPACGFEGEFCIEDPNARLLRVIGIFIGVLVGTILIGTTAILGIYKKMKYEKELSDMKWKVNLKKILMANHSAYSKSMISILSTRTIMSGCSSVKGRPSQKFIQTGVYEGQTVAVKVMPHVKQVNLSDRSFLRVMAKLYELSHPNLVKFVGAFPSPPDVCLLTEYCVKGSLQDILESDDIKLDWTFKWSLMNDIVQGLAYLHDSVFEYHGNLKSSNCVVDSRFVVKLTDHAPREWLQKENIKSEDLLWTSPELLTSSTCRATGNPRGDVYAYGIILHEIVMREGPFFVDDMLSADDILKELLQGNKKQMRPKTDGLDCPIIITELMTQCWHQDPNQRPSLTDIKNILRKTSGMKGSVNIMDNLLARMEQYATNLETLVEERTGKYMEEKKRAEDLLHRLLPASIVKELQENGHVNPASYECVTIYFSDIVQFTNLCSESTPIQVVNMLNDLYTLFDNIIAEYDVYKVETIGDAYMTVSGLPQINGDRHVREIGQMALSLLHNIRNFHIRHRPDHQLLLRIGLHSGPVVAGVVGHTMPRYCLFGDTVNTASRMESHGEALKIHISEETYKLLRLQGGFEMESRGKTEIKGKGLQTTYWLNNGPE